MIDSLLTAALFVNTPDASTWATCGCEHVFFAGYDVNCDRSDDIVIVGSDRKLHWSPNVSGWKAAGWRPVREEPLAEGVVDFASVTYLTGGEARRAILVLTPESSYFLSGGKLEVVKQVAVAGGKRFKAIVSGEPLVVETEGGNVWRLGGDSWDEATDLVPTSQPVDGPPPNAPPYQPDAKLMRVFLADISGDGVADRAAVYRMSRFGEYQELRVAIAPNPGTKDSDADGLNDDEEKQLGSNPRDRDSDDDGLLDGWEVKGLPRGINIGDGNTLNPLRQDVVVSIALYEQVDRAAAEKEMVRVAELYKSLTSKNPDGSTGLTVHFRYEAENVPLDRQHGGSWQAVGNARFPLPERGLMHWMQITPWGGGQAAQTGDMGGCGMGFAVFTHEFGHQLGLSHTGDSDAAWCPLYPSLMSYAFSYSLGGDGNAIRFSDGRFRGVELIESKLSERLPFAYEEVKYLASPPFRYNLESDGNGGTKIDWNQNGAFDEGTVAADINYGGSTDCGIRRPLDQTAAGPALAYVGDACWLLSLGLDQGALSLQQYLGAEKWSEKAAIPDSGTVDDPLLVGTATHGYAFFRRSLGWYVARFAPAVTASQEAATTDGGKPAPPKIDAPVHLADLPRCELSAGVVGGRILLVARRDDDSLETYWLDYADKPVIQRGQTLETRSIAPVGFGQSPGDKRLALVSTAAKNSRGAAQCMRVTYCDVAGDRLIERETVWTRGEGSGNGCTSRPVVVFDSDGQLNIFHTGGQNGDGSMLVYRTRRIGNRELDEGWLTCMLYDIWTRTRRPIAFANGPQGGIYAFRWDADGWTKNNTLLLGYNGFGLNAEPMRDFDDGEKISRYGLVHSILWMQPE